MVSLPKRDTLFAEIARRDGLVPASALATALETAATEGISVVDALRALQVLPPTTRTTIEKALAARAFTCSQKDYRER